MLALSLLQKREAIDLPLLSSRPLTSRYSEVNGRGPPYSEVNGRGPPYSEVNGSYRMSPLAPMAIQHTDRTARSADSERSLSVDGSTMQHAALSQLKRSPSYQVTCAVLRTLQSLTAHIDNIALLRRPLNLIFVELYTSFADPLVRQDAPFRYAIYDVLKNYSVHVEQVHVSCRDSNVRGVSNDDMRLERRRKDTLLFRIAVLLSHALHEQQTSRDMSEVVGVLMRMASEYIQHCATRITAVVAMDLLLQPLLCLKELLFSLPLPTNNDVPMVSTVHSFIELLDSLADASTHEPLDAALHQIVMHPSTHQWLCAYAQQLLLTSEWAKQLAPKAFLTVEACRLRVVQHFRVVVRLLQGHRVVPSDSRGLSSLTFLLHPTTGLLMSYIRMPLKTQHASVRYQILLLLCEIFSAPDSWFVHEKEYIDSYIRFHYFSFFELYNNNSTDRHVLHECCAHLKILVAFAARKNPEISKQFYTLGVMDLALRELNLEWCMTQVWLFNSSSPLVSAVFFLVR